MCQCAPQVVERVQALVRQAVGLAAESIRAALTAPWPQWTSDLLPVVSFLTVASTSKCLACSPLYSEIPTLQRSLQWFVQYHAAALKIVADDADAGEVASMPHDVCVSTFVCFRGMWPSMPAEVEKALGAECVAECLEVAARLHSRPVVQQALRGLESCIGKDLDAWQHKLDVQASEADEHHAKVLAMSKTLGDTRLEHQAHFLRDVLQAKRVTAMLMEKQEAGSGSRDALAISAAWCALVAPVRHAAHALEVLIQQKDTVEALFAKAGPQDPPHVGCLDESLELEPLELLRNIVSEARSLVKSLVDGWAQDLSDLCKGVSDGCPAWQAMSQDPAFLTADRVKTFLTNPMYMKLTPMCNLIGEMLGHLMELGKVLDPALAKTAKEVRTLGYNTVSFTYGLYQAYVAIPKLPNQAQKRKAVADLRQALSDKDFKELPVALENKLSALAGEAAPEPATT